MHLLRQTAKRKTRLQITSTTHCCAVLGSSSGLPNKFGLDSSLLSVQDKNFLAHKTKPAGFPAGFDYLKFPQTVKLGKKFREHPFVRFSGAPSRNRTGTA